MGNDKSAEITRQDLQARSNGTAYRVFPELEIVGDRYRIYAWLEAAAEFKGGHPRPLVR